MKTSVTLDPGNRIVLTRAVREAAGIPAGATLTMTVTPGAIVIGREPVATKLVKKGKLLLLDADSPKIPITDAIKSGRRGQ